MGAIIALVAEIISVAPQLIAAGVDAWALITKAKAVIDENKVVGDPEWEALEAKITELQAGALRDTTRDI